MGIKPTFTKNLPLNVFELLIYQNAKKKHAKHPLWRNIITLPKTCILSVFDHFTNNLSLSVFELLIYKTAKIHAKHTLWRNRITLPKPCIYG